MNEAEELNNGHFPQRSAAQQRKGAGVGAEPVSVPDPSNESRGFFSTGSPNGSGGVHFFLVLTRPTALEGCDFFSTGGVHFFSVLPRPTTLEGSVLTRPTALEGCIFLSTDLPNDSGGVRCF